MKKKRPYKALNVPHPDDPDMRMHYDFSNAVRRPEIAERIAKYGYSYPVYHDDGTMERVIVPPARPDIETTESV